MEYVILILSIVLFIFSLLCIVDMIKGDGLDGKPLIFILFIYSLLVLLLSFFYIRKPKAIDVYKGNTTLEITYKNKVPIDSTVVWKNNH